MPYYLAGDRVDASGSIAATIEEIEPLLAEPAGTGTLVLRAQTHGGFMELGTGIFGSSLVHVLRSLSARRCVVVTAPQSRKRAELALEHVRLGTGLPTAIVELPEGQRSKLIEEQEILFRKLADLRLERPDPLIAVGDDVLLEAATFAAAVYLRGLPLVTIPVTTLGLIDTSIGGKGGIDLPGVGSNLLGAIHQPKAAILDIDLVQDEPVAERRAAMAEVIKYGLIGDTVLLSLLEVGVHPEAGKGWPGPWSCSRSSSAVRWQSVAWSYPTNGTETASGWHSTSGTRSAMRWKQRLGIGSATAKRWPTAFAPPSTSACPWASRRPPRRTARRG